MSESVEERLAWLRRLRTVRRFRPDPIPDAVLHDLLEVARWSGSAKNLQPWEFVVVRERATLRALSELEGFVWHLAGAAAAILLVIDGDRERRAQETFDEGRLSERIQLAASAHGLGASIAWLVGEGQREAKRLLGIPAERLLRTAISLGYPAPGEQPASAIRGRKPLAALVSYERYGERG
jgi:nitroreductase